MQVLYLSMLLLVFVFTVFFAILNRSLVDFNFFVGHINIELAWLLLGAFFSGALLTMLSCSIMLLKGQAQTRSMRHELESVKKEVGQLRVLPLKEGD